VLFVLTFECACVLGMSSGCLGRALVVSLAQHGLAVVLLWLSHSLPGLLLDLTGELFLVLLLPHSLGDSRCSLPVRGDVGNYLAVLLEVLEELLLGLVVVLLSFGLLPFLLLLLFLRLALLGLLGILLSLDVGGLLLLSLLLQLTLALQRVHLRLDIGL